MSLIRLKITGLLVRQEGKLVLNVVSLMSQTFTEKATKTYLIFQAKYFLKNTLNHLAILHFR